MRTLALDFGESRCGIAISDPDGTIATPLDVIERPDTRRGIDRIGRLARERGVGRVVVGLPVTLIGSEGAQARRTREFADRLSDALPILVVLHDERLTTRQAQQSGGRAPLDSRAAAHLLESYLAAARAVGAGEN